jgi:hypothetical protein
MIKFLFGLPSPQEYRLWVYLIGVFVIPFLVVMPLCFPAVVLSVWLWYRFIILPSLNFGWVSSPKIRITRKDNFNEGYKQEESKQNVHHANPVINPQSITSLFAEDGNSNQNTKSLNNISDIPKPPDKKPYRFADDFKQLNRIILRIVSHTLDSIKT